jgi:hypothetical protein
MIPCNCTVNVCGVMTDDRSICIFRCTPWWVWLTVVVAVFIIAFSIYSYLSLFKK